MSMPPIPDLVDNRKHKLADILREVLAQGQNPRLDVVTAFFNLNRLQFPHPRGPSAWAGEGEGC